MRMIRAVLLITEAFFSIVALATENYWLFIPALLAAAYDLFASRTKPVVPKKDPKPKRF